MTVTVDLKQAVRDLEAARKALEKPHAGEAEAAAYVDALQRRDLAATPLRWNSDKKAE